MQGGTFMHKQYTYMDADWNNLEVLQRNRLKTRFSVDSPIWMRLTEKRQQICGL